MHCPITPFQVVSLNVYDHLKEPQNLIITTTVPSFALSVVRDKKESARKKGLRGILGAGGFYVGPHYFNFLFSEN